MLLMGFLYIGAMIALWLAVYAVLKYAVPDSLPGRIATILT